MWILGPLNTLNDAKIDEATNTLANKKTLPTNSST